MRLVQHHIGQELRGGAAPSTPSTGTPEGESAVPLRPFLSELFDAFTHCLQHRSSCSVFLEGLHNHYDLSAPLFRLLLHLPRVKDPYHLVPCLNIVSSILRLDHARLYASTPLTAVLKMFPVGEVVVAPLQPAYEPRSSSFSIANLTTSTTASKSKEVSLPATLNMTTTISLPGTIKPTLHPGTVKSTSLADRTTMTISSRGLHTQCDINNEEDVLCSLMATPSHALERHVRALVEIAVKCGQLTTVRAALSRLLLLSAHVKTETKIPRRSIALLLDWLHVVDPELLETPQPLRKMLLFSKYKDKPLGVGLGGYSQAYLLGTFTQQANWKTLEQTVKELLGGYDPSLNPGGVLDFVWAVTRVPKLWQGRERRTPRHASDPLLMRLQPLHLQTLALYVLGEKCEYFDINTEHKTKAPDRLPLLLQWYRDNDALYADLISKLCQSSILPVDTPERKANRSLLFQLYLRRPRVLTLMTSEARVLLPVMASADEDDGESAADVAIHCLLTMICSPVPGREFRKRLPDMEAAIRTLACRHPLLVLRHSHLIFSGLGGLTPLNLIALKGNNNFDVLLVVVGVLELLHPHLFSLRHNQAVARIFDCYLDIFGRHGSPPDLMAVATRVVDLIHAWLATDRPRALLYLVPKTALLKSLSLETKEWRSLAVAAASAPTTPMQIPTEDPTLHAPALPLPNTAWLHGEAESVTAKLTHAKPGEEQSEAWRLLSNFASRAPMAIVARRFPNFLCWGLHNSESGIRDIAWGLTAKVLLHDPSLAPQFVAAVLHALHSSDCSVARCACEKLPDVILTMHEAAPDVLTAAFVAVTSRVPSSISDLTKALTLLTLHTGA
ncbi:integrator complex subunit 1-like [Hyalella azteca]|uniref:Integrator complex subunit 1-like n=1 Tax=Hyalella azteca TaxID=294128 RepID=A0A979FK77_HYAAZ|nr:integrator complex subunit 1-like [Hyalella azteca]